MNSRSINRTDAVGAGLTVILGAFAILESLSYSIGTFQRMGPGFFPLALGLCLVGLGVGIFATAWTSDTLAPAHYAIRSAIAVLASVVTFALVFRWFGLMPASVALVCVSSLADRNRSITGVLFLSVVLGAAVCGLFVFALGLPFDVVKAPWSP